MDRLRDPTVWIAAILLALTNGAQIATRPDPVAIREQVADEIGDEYADCRGDFDRVVGKYRTCKGDLAECRGVPMALAVEE